MIPIIFCDENFENNDYQIPADVENLARRFWNPIGTERQYYKRFTNLTLGELNPVVLNNSPRRLEKYYLFKIIKIHKIEENEIMVTNIFSGYNGNNATKLDFFLNDDGNSILNSEGTYNYNRPPINAQIFAINENSKLAGTDISIKSFSKNTSIQAVFFQGWLNKAGEFDHLSESKNRLYIKFMDYNIHFIQRIIINPFNQLVKIFFPKFKPAAGGGSSAGVRVPPKGGQ